jgi:hypothetical protein
MSMKRKTKSQREAEQKAALLQRITDVYSGALGDLWDDENNWASAEQLSKVIPALQKMFGSQREDNGWCWNMRCIEYFDTPTSACDHLYENGFRA